MKFKKFSKKLLPIITGKLKIATEESKRQGFTYKIISYPTETLIASKQ